MACASAADEQAEDIKLRESHSLQALPKGRSPTKGSTGSKVAAHQPYWYGISVLAEQYQLRQR